MSIKHQTGTGRKPRERVNIVAVGSPDNYAEARAWAIVQITESHGSGGHRKVRQPIRVRTVRTEAGIERTFVFEV